MRLPEGILLDTCYEILEDSLEIVDESDDSFLEFCNRGSLILTIYDNYLEIEIVIKLYENHICVDILDFRSDLHWINFIASKLENFIKDNLKEYTIKEYVYIANTIIRSIKEALKPISNFEIYTSTAKKAL